MPGISGRIKDDIRENKIQYLLLVFFLIVGITSGTFSVAHMRPGEKTALSGYMELVFEAVNTQQIDYLGVFFHSLIQDTVLFGMMAVFSMSFLGIPFIAAVITAKGFFVGFTSAVLAVNFGFSGFAAIIFSTFIPNLVFLPCIVKAGELCVNNCVAVFRTRKIPGTARDRLVNARPHLKKMLAAYLLSVLGVLLETLLTPSLIRML